MKRREFLEESSLRLATSTTLTAMLSTAVQQAKAVDKTFHTSQPVVNEADFAGPLVQTTTVFLKRQPVRIHAITTGRVAVTTAFRTARGGIFRKANILLDRHFTEFMPIWVWVIEHPEGVLVIDTGENANVLQPDYFDRTGAFHRFVNHRAFHFDIVREQEIDSQLARLGISSDKIRRVVLTHLHLDHTDGLRHFANTEIVVARPEFEHPYNNLPELYPRWFKPHLVDFQKDKLAVFPQAVPLTDAGDVWLVHTPGHTHHHSSVLLQADETHYLFAGDVSYNQEQLLRNELAGGNANQSQTRHSYDHILTYARQHPLVYLPSHDGESADRLLNRSVLHEHTTSSNNKQRG